MLTFRAATSEDIPLLTGWNHQLLEDERSPKRFTLPELEARLTGWFTRNKYQATIFELDDTPVAYVLYRSEESGAIYLRQFFVSREHRRQGIGKAAIAMLFNGIFPADQRITLDVLIDNERARAFWTAVGFRPYAITMERNGASPDSG